MIFLRKQKSGLKNGEMITIEMKLLNNSCVNRSIWLIERIWFNSLENEINSAVGYSPFGYVENEEKAKEFCKKGKICTQEDCWAVYKEKPEYRYKEIKYYR